MRPHAVVGRRQLSRGLPCSSASTRIHEYGDGSNKGTDMKRLPDGRRFRASPRLQQAGQPFALRLAQAGADHELLRAASDGQPLPAGLPVQADFADFRPCDLAAPADIEAEVEMTGVV